MNFFFHLTSNKALTGVILFLTRHKMTGHNTGVLLNLSQTVILQDEFNHSVILFGFSKVFFVQQDFYKCIIFFR